MSSQLVFGLLHLPMFHAGCGSKCGDSDFIPTILVELFYTWDESPGGKNKIVGALTQAVNKWIVKTKKKPK